MTALDFILGGCTALVAGLIPLYALCYLVYFLVSLPLRRQERARFFLHLLETGLAQGHSLERTIVSISQSRDPSLGGRFHLLASYLASGWKLGPALEKAGGFLPPQIVAMFRVGEEIGDPGRIVPACRALLQGAPAQIQNAYNYLVVLAFVLVPVVPILFWLVSVFVIPKYEAIFADLLEGEALPVLPFRAAAILSQFQIFVALAFYLGAILYIGGPRFIAWIQAGFSTPPLDGLVGLIPWKRKRLHRDFGAMLGVLLDAEVPESRAVMLAAESTANRAFVKRARAVIRNLEQGLPLPDALLPLDRSGEFRWRLANAIHANRGFLAALTGWLEGLEARAFQQQQAFAQAITTAVVIYNGLMVSLFASFVFRSFVRVIEEGILW